MCQDPEWASVEMRAVSLAQQRSRAEPSPASPWVALRVAITLDRRRR